MNRALLTRDRIICDMGLAVIATICLYFGFDHEGYLSNAALIYGGVLFGYLAATYLNMED